MGTWQEFIASAVDVLMCMAYWHRKKEERDTLPLGALPQVRLERWLVSPPGYYQRPPTPLRRIPSRALLLLCMPAGNLSKVSEHTTPSFSPSTLCSLPHPFHLLPATQVTPGDGLGSPRLKSGFNFNWLLWGQALLGTRSGGGPEGCLPMCPGEPLCLQDLRVLRNPGEIAPGKMEYWCCPISLAPDAGAQLKTYR